MNDVLRNAKRRRREHPALYSTAGDPYSRVDRRCGQKRRPLEAFFLEGNPYCTGCGRTLYKHWKRYEWYGQERFKALWLHYGPIFSTTAGC